ncbi:MAG: FAD-dependent oxidoreductase [Deltaproteobacteria bacterium]|nr:FAD-dependent oxidoreductase [Deltaproteobacteria bacterium]
MNTVRSLMGRRQFLVAAGVTSVSALGYKRQAGIVGPVFQAEAAMASQKSGEVDMNGQYSYRYSHLLSPLRIGNVIVKNRMMQAVSFPRYLMGPESFPSEQVINHYANIAKNGCAICMLMPINSGNRPSAGGPGGEGGQDGAPGAIPGGAGVQDGKRIVTEGDHMPVWDADEVTVQHYIAQLTDAIHYYGSLAAIGGQAGGEGGYSISTVALVPSGPMGKEELGQGKEIPVEMIQKMCEDAATHAMSVKSLGFDMVHFHMAYQNNIMAHSLSPVLNKRTDKYGGSIEKRARLTLEIAQAVKKACGQDFLVGANISGEENLDGGYTTQDATEYAKIWEGAVDILVIRGKDRNASHPNGYNLKKDDNPILHYSEAIKKGGTRVVIAPNGGFQNLDVNEECIAAGKADMISMARAWYADPEYGKKAYEGRGEDVVPCVMCSECHGANEGPWLQYCSVNPKMGIAHKVNLMIDAPVVSRKVAVIGGGPAGMKAAITAAERGHRVTLYEKNDFLGGQLKYTDYVSFKWPYKDYKDYLIRQLDRAGVEVRLNTQATPEMIKSKGYDVLLAALGAEQIIPDIPGAKGGNVRSAMFVYGNERALGKNIVVIGGDLIGAETGMHLAEKGHKITVLAEEGTLAPDVSQYVSWDFIRAYESLEAQGNFSYITGAKATGISDMKVTYVVAGDGIKSINADSVVIYAGRRPRQEEAMRFAGSAGRFFIIGDCSARGDVRRHFEANLYTSVRSGFAAASEI